MSFAASDRTSGGSRERSPARPDIAWCGKEPVDATTATVATNDGALNVRSGPSTAYPRMGVVQRGAALSVRCQAWGLQVNGVNNWLQIGEAKYVSEAYVGWSERPWLPWCGQEAQSVPPGNSKSFIAAAVQPAQNSQKEYAVPASVTIAQAILETGWGRSKLNREDHNYFGMKCFGNPGSIALGCRDYGTRECSGTRCWDTHDEFRAYRNPAASYADHGKQLSTLSRYATAMKHTKDADQFAREIHKAGYATGPTYSDKLIDLMKQHDLYQYDIRVDAHGNNR